MKKILLVSLALGVAVGTTRAQERIRAVEDVVYGHKEGLALTFDVLIPEPGNGAGVIHVLSGGWQSGWEPPAELAHRHAPLLEKGYAVFIVRHGSAPRFKVYEAVEDVRRASRFIHVHAEQFGVSPDRIGAYGGSASGHMALMLGTAWDEGDPEAEDPVERASDRVAAVVAFFPPVDLREAVAEAPPGSAFDFDPELAVSVSPLLHISDGDAPTLIIHGEKDEAVPVSGSERAAAAFEKTSVPFELMVIPNAGHGTIYGMADTSGFQAIDRMLAWFDDHLLTAAE